MLGSAAVTTCGASTKDKIDMAARASRVKSGYPGGCATPPAQAAARSSPLSPPIRKEFARMRRCSTSRNTERMCRYQKQSDMQ
jgi:hypothetical protein